MREALREFAARHPGGMRGASAEEIEALERVAGPLPPDYKLFLSALGHAWPEALKLNPDLAYESVFKYHYARFNKRKREARDPKKARAQAKRPRDRMLVIAPSPATDPHDIAIDVEQPGSPVYETSECCGTRPLAASLREYVFGPAAV
jgi:hypothetical protein